MFSVHRSALLPGPILLCLYMLPPEDIIRKYNLSFHFYADVQTLLECLKEISDWMGDNFLQLNDSKTEVIIFSPSKFNKPIFTDLSSRTPFIKPSARNLGNLSFLIRSYALISKFPPSRRTASTSSEPSL